MSPIFSSLIAHITHFADLVATGPVKCDLSNTHFFIIPPWWEYLKGEVDPLGVCSPAFNFPTDIWAVGLAILDMLIRLAGFVAVVSIMVAGLQYVIAIGNTDKTTASRKRIQNSLIGLAIAAVATATVTFIGRYFS